ncbi:MAG: 2-dehydro-3-deoxygalactonokinase [Proteobacteria bacterium]|nr:2-dehydro-3-deoxygalactonokinase [Pseudomonadota bacterium]
MSAARVLGDWGGTNLRLFRVQDGVVTARLDGPGTTALSGNAAEVLAERLALWLAEGPIAGVTLCGMAGSPAGLVVAPYAPCPANAAQWQAFPAMLEVAGVPVAVLPGLSARDGRGVPDVMRGEEAQVFGAMALDPALAHGRHVIVLPGTHSKWVMLDDGAITGFRTAPTGELYALIAGQSSLTGNDAPGEGSFDDGFARGLARADEPLPCALFEARAARLLDGRSRAWAQGYLSGLLIGAEVAQFAPDTGPVVVVGTPALAALYARALTARGLAFTAVDGDAAVLAGLTLTLQESSQP